MIIKEYEDKPKTGNRVVDAGHKAEKQMAFYLRRAFVSRKDLFILNDIRIVDPEQQHEGLGEDACQIDHLVLHRWGMFIVESKSSIGKVVIKSDGTGGDEWAFGGMGRGSPIKQAEMQACYIRTFLNRHREQLLGRLPVGLRTVGKIVAESEHRGVGLMPMQSVVALSDSATVSRGRWKEPSEPFQAYVCKADLACDKIIAEYKRHKKAGGLLGKRDGNYGMWSMKPEEAQAVAEFLRDNHKPRNQSNPRRRKLVGAKEAVSDKAVLKSTGSICKACGSTSLSARYGRFGYYWVCLKCSEKTTMPKMCNVCGADGKKSKDVRVRKAGPKYYTSCSAFGIEECIWTEPGVSS